MSDGPKKLLDDRDAPVRGVELACLTVLAITLSAGFRFFMSRFDGHPAQPDTAYYLGMLLDLDEGGPVAGYWPALSPLYPYVAWAVHRTGVDVFSALRWVPLAASVLFAGAYVLFTYEMSGGRRSVILIAGAFALFNPMLNYFQGKMLPESLYYFVFVLAFFFFFRSIRKNSRACAVVMGCLLALGALTRFEGAFFAGFALAAMFPAMLAVDPGAWRRYLKTILIAAVPLTLALLAMSFMTYRQAGIFFPTTIGRYYAYSGAEHLDRKIVPGADTTIETIVYNERRLPSEAEYAAHLRLSEEAASDTGAAHRAERAEPARDGSALLRNVKTFLLDRYRFTRYIFTERLGRVFAPWLLLPAGAGLLAAGKWSGKKRVDLIALALTLGLILFFCLVKMQAKRYFVFILFPGLVWAAEGAADLYARWKGRGFVRKFSAVLPILLPLGIFLIDVTEPIRAAGVSSAAGSHAAMEEAYKTAGLAIREFSEKNGIRNPRILMAREASVYARGYCYYANLRSPLLGRFLDKYAIRFATASPQAAEFLIGREDLDCTLLPAQRENGAVQVLVFAQRFLPDERPGDTVP